jgi:hypothetical protein
MRFDQRAKGRHVHDPGGVPGTHARQEDSVGFRLVVPSRGAPVPYSGFHC